MLSSKLDVYVIPITSRLRDLCQQGRGLRRLLRFRGCGWFQGNGFSTHNRTDTHMKSEIVAAFRRPSQVPAQQNLRMEEEIWARSPTCSQWTIDIWFLLQERKSVSSMDWCSYTNHTPDQHHDKKKLANTSWTLCLVILCHFHIEKEAEREREHEIG